MTSAAPFLPLWPETAGGRAALINHTENHTYRVDSPRGRFVLRVHRPGYHDRSAIGAELAWIADLRRTSGLDLPEQVGPVREAGGRLAVLFRHIAGREPEPEEALFERLGGYAATLHLNAGAAGARPVWDEAILDRDGPWGDWRALGPGLAEVELYLREALAGYGKPSHRFAQIHADMRMANLLADGERLALIDFDDCGLGWFMYDFAAAVSFIETDRRLPRWRDAWLRGYTRVRSLGEADLAIIPAMILLRRMALLAWIGSHGETDLARRHGPGFAAATLALFRSMR